MYQERGSGGRGGGSRDGGSRGFSNDRTLTPPVREGQEVDVTIEAVGEKGDGIAKVQGFVLFVPATKAGERVRIRITRVLQKVGFGQVIGEAQTAASAPVQRERAPKPEFNPNEEMDSEDFGDDSGEGSSTDGEKASGDEDVSGEDAGDSDTEDDASDDEEKE